MVERNIEYICADESWRSRVAIDFGEIAARHMHIADGVSILSPLRGKGGWPSIDLPKEVDPSLVRDV
jgi:hypothetical protein